MVGVPPNRRNVKMVFQHLALFPMMNVGENIAYGLRCRGDGRAEIERKVSEVLARVGLPGVEGKRGQPSSPAARSSASPSRAAWCWSRTCCCSTSRWARST